MIVSTHGKSYDTADGSEQFREDGAAPTEGSRQTAAQRWADDGGPTDEPVPPALAVKPPWSVLSLRDLNAAIAREAGPPHDPARIRHADEQAARASAAAAAVDARRRADAALAWADRDRNAWEHT